MLLECRKFLTLPIVIFQQKRHITESSNVGKCITARLDAWEKGHFDSLISSTIAVAWEKMKMIQQDVDKAHQEKVVTRLLVEGKLGSAVCYVMEREGGLILDMHTLNAKSRKSVVGVLWRKHSP